MFAKRSVFLMVLSISSMIDKYIWLSYHLCLQLPQVLLLFCVLTLVKWISLFLCLLAWLKKTFEDTTLDLGKCHRHFNSFLTFYSKNNKLKNNYLTPEPISEDFEMQLTAQKNHQRRSSVTQLKILQKMFSQSTLKMERTIEGRYRC